MLTSYHILANIAAILMTSAAECIHSHKYCAQAIIVTVGDKVFHNIH